LSMININEIDLNIPHQTLLHILSLNSIRIVSKE
jgi:hypothetical protein